MRLAPYIALYLLLGLAVAMPALGETRRVDLGSPAEAASLFAPPCKERCDLDRIAAEAAHYLEQSLRRDGHAGLLAGVGTADGRLQAVLDGPGAEGEAEALAGFLRLGGKARTAYLALAEAGRLAPGWSLYLPLGMPLTGRRSLSLMNFPPDSAQKRADYLSAATLRHWRSLLILNGVPGAMADGFQGVVDILPIAAPADADQELEARVPKASFRDYVSGLIGLWSRDADGRVLPMVVFGAPARRWLAEGFGLDLLTGETGLFTPPGRDQPMPVYAANHPSLIFHAAFDRDGRADPARGMKTMRADLIAACWQARMGLGEGGGPAQVARDCARRWHDDRAGVCGALERLVYHRREEDIPGLCSPKS